MQLAVGGNYCVSFDRPLDERQSGAQHVEAMQGGLEATVAGLGEYELVLVAGGIGINPLLSIFRQVFVPFRASHSFMCVFEVCL